MSHFGSASNNKTDFVHGLQYEKMPTWGIIPCEGHIFSAKVNDMT